MLKCSLNGFSLMVHPFVLFNFHLILFCYVHICSGNVFVVLIYVSHMQLKTATPKRL